MRKIKFRAIGSVDTKWYYGQYVKCNSYKESVECIADEENHFIEIDPETIGQFTGLYDKKRTTEYPNGQPIYEGDIVMSVEYDRKIVKDVVSYNHSYGTYRPFGTGIEDLAGEDCTVIGNIYENPELLNG